MTEPWPGYRKWGTGSGRPRDRAQGPGRAAASRLACPVPGCPAVLAPVPPTRGPRHGRGKARWTDAEGALLRGIRRGRLPGPASLPGQRPSRERLCCPRVAGRGSRLPQVPPTLTLGHPAPLSGGLAPSPSAHQPLRPAGAGPWPHPSLCLHGPHPHRGHVTVCTTHLYLRHTCESICTMHLSTCTLLEHLHCTPEHTYLTCLYHASEQTYLT